jgi:rod shape-determining protein MreD
MSHPLQRFEDMVKASLPVISCIFLLMLIIVPWPSPMIKMVFSTLPLMALCFWIVNQPDHMGMGWSFILGFMQDVLLVQPLGVTALTYLAADFFLRGQRNFFLQQSFQHLWMMFAFVMVGVSVVQWLVASLLIHGWVDVVPVALRMGLGILFFPMMTMVLHNVQRVVFSRS